MKRAIFVENEKQVETILAGFSRNTGADIWVALTPLAMYALEYRGLDYRTLERYFDPLQVYAEDQKIVEKLLPFYAPSGQFAALIHKHSGIEVNVGGYQFRRWVTQFELTLSALSAFFEAERPQELIYCTAEFEKKEFEERIQVPDLYKRCLRFLACSYNFSVNEIAMIPEKNIPQESRIVKKNDFLPILRAIKKCLKIFLYRFIHMTKKKEKRGILLLSLAYDLEFVARWLIKSGKYPLYLYNCALEPSIEEEPESLNPAVSPSPEKGRYAEKIPPIEEKVDRFWEELQASLWFRENFVWKGIDYYGIIEDRLRTVFRDNIIKLNIYYHKHLDMLNRYSIGLILSPYVNVNPITTSIWHAARKNGIKIAVYQHGGGYGYQLYGDHILFEFRNIDAFFSYGTGMVEYLRLSNIDFDKVLPTGSLRLSHYRQAGKTPGSALRRELLQGKNGKLVLIAPTYVFPVWRFPDTQFLLCRTYALERRVVDLCALFPEIRFVIKLSPNDRGVNPIPHYIESRNLANCTVRYQPSLIEHLQAADMIILFDQLSTKFIEALALDIPICAFSFPWFKIDPKLKLKFEKSLFFSTDEEDFLSRLRERLTQIDRGDRFFKETLDAETRDLILIDDDRVLPRVEKALYALLHHKPLAD